MTDRAEQFATAVINEYGITEEAVRFIARKFIEQDELREKLQAQLIEEIGLNNN